MTIMKIREVFIVLYALLIFSSILKIGDIRFSTNFKQDFILKGGILFHKINLSSFQILLLFKLIKNLKPWQITFDLF